MNATPGPRRSAPLAAIVFVFAAAFGAIVPAQTPPARVVAIGDVHGSLGGLRAILRSAGLLGADGHWSGGATTFVQTGDLTDRGPDVRDVFDLLRQLEREAPARGGRVVALLGNHEVMNLLGELRDVTPAICAAFAGPTANATRQQAWRDYAELVRDRARTRGGEQPPGLARTEQTFLAAYPPGCLEYREALGPRGDYGRWLRGLPIAAKVERTVFMHAGAPPQTVDSLEDTVAQARTELARYDRFVDRLVRAKLALPWFRLEDVLGVAAAEVRWLNARVERARADGAPIDLAGIDVDLVKEAAAVLGIGGWSLLKADGPLWYRGYALADESTLATPVPAFLARWDADRLVVGHSVMPDSRIRARLGGRVFLIDTGMLEAVYKGRPSALELIGAGAHAIYVGGQRIQLAAPGAAP